MKRDFRLLAPPSDSGGVKVTDLIGEEWEFDRERAGKEEEEGEDIEGFGLAADATLAGAMLPLEVFEEEADEL